MKEAVVSFFRRLDPHSLEVLRGAGLAFALRAVGAGFAFLLNVMIGRLLGAEGAGLYFLALSMVSIGAVIVKLGFDNALLRFVASGASRGDWNAVIGVVQLGLRLAAGSSLAVIFLVFAFAPWIADQIFGEPVLAPTLRVMSLGIFTFSAMTLLAECLKGLKRIRNSMLVSGVLYPAIALILIWPLASRFGATGAAMAYVAGTGGAAAIGWMMWRANTRTWLAPLPSFSRRALWQSCRPLWLMEIINRGILPWMPLFLLGIWGTPEEVGIFGAATRVAMSVHFFLIAVNTVIAPKFAELYVKGEIDTLGRLAWRFALLITLVASPLFLLFIFAGDWVMGLFGPEFTRGGTVLAILAAGQAIVAMTGIAGQILMMTGHGTETKNASFLALALLALIAIVAIPTLGAIGAALSNAIALASMSIYSVVMAKKKLYGAGRPKPKTLDTKI